MASLNDSWTSRCLYVFSHNFDHPSWTHGLRIKSSVILATRVKLNDNPITYLRKGDP